MRYYYYYYLVVFVSYVYLARANISTSGHRLTELRKHVDVPKEGNTEAALWWQIFLRWLGV